MKMTPRQNAIFGVLQLGHSSKPWEATMASRLRSEQLSHIWWVSYGEESETFSKLESGSIECPMKSSIRRRSTGYLLLQSNRELILRSGLAKSSASTEQSIAGIT